jgi:NAD(P)-dependent dehydrogenase (short-subunit alcohol dehydrogenase family)
MSTFDGRSALVTGGGTGIGKGCAQHFLAHGATVTIAGPDGDVLESAAAELRDTTGNEAVRTALCDVTEESKSNARWRQPRTTAGWTFSSPTPAPHGRAPCS